MSRAAPSLARGLAASSSRPRSALNLARRTYAAGSSDVSGNTSSVDPRIFDGIDGFIPKQNVDMLCEWQSGLWERLQAEVRSNPGLLEVKQKWDKQGLDMTYLLTHAARDPQLTMSFNYASLLVNNSFFLESLHGGEVQNVPSHYAQLEEKVAAYAEGISGSAWLWIVRSSSNHADVDIVPSFGSGTLLVTNRAQRGREDVPVFGTPASPEESADTTAPEAPAESSETDASAPTTESALTSGFTGTSFNTKYSGVRAKARESVTGPVPLAVLNLYEHAYLGEKYGVWGRQQYAKDWFRKLNWNKIGERSAKVAGR